MAEVEVGLGGGRDLTNASIKRFLSYFVILCNMLSYIKVKLVHHHCVASARQHRYVVFIVELTTKNPHLKEGEQ